MKLKKLPYGLTDFKRIQIENYYYVDKTSFILDIEDGADLVTFLRPRRFGKSLMINMLCAYYDIHYKPEFKDIFQYTYIYTHQTPLKNSFYILKFDFSKVDITEYESSFRNNLNLTIKSFIDKYNLDLVLNQDNPIDNLNSLFSYCYTKNLSIYLLIDEYDNFVTKLLTSSISQYKNMVTTKTAIYKEFFTMLKGGTSDNDSAVKKIFITGVSPLALYDVTSGSNNIANITLDTKLNDLVGVTKDELKQMIAYYGFEDKQDMIIRTCDEWYNSYIFSEDANHTIYNSDMILYYFDKLIKNNKEPSNLIDSNLRTDYSKLKYLLLNEKKLNGNFTFLNNLLEGKQISLMGIKDSFSAFELSNADNFKSFMFSLGFCTIKKNLFKLDLKAPNQTIKKLLAEFIHYAYKEFDNYKIDIDALNEHLLNLAYDKDLSAFRYIADIIKSNSSLRDFIDGENFVKAYFLTYLNLNNFYEVTSEKESNKGYIDILLHPCKDEVPYGVIIELKYIKRKEFNETKKLQKLQEAIDQLNQYDLGDRYLKVALVFNGWEMVECVMI